MMVVYYFVFMRKQIEDELKSQGFSSNLEKLNHLYQTRVRTFERYKDEIIREYHLNSDYFETDSTIQIDCNPLNNSMEFVHKSASLDYAKRSLDEHKKALEALSTNTNQLNFCNQSKIRASK